jgi:hypothetical protein
MDASMSRIMARSSPEPCSRRRLVQRVVRAEHQQDDVGRWVVARSLAWPTTVVARIPDTPGGSDPTGSPVRSPAADIVEPEPVLAGERPQLASVAFVLGRGQHVRQTQSVRVPPKAECAARRSRALSRDRPSWRGPSGRRSSAAAKPWLRLQTYGVLLVAAVPYAPLRTPPTTCRLGAPSLLQAPTSGGSSVTYARILAPARRSRPVCRSHVRTSLRPVRRVQQLSLRQVPE